MAKSFEKNTKMFYSTYIKEYMKDNLENIATFIGPSFANELFNKKATIINVFGNNPRFITSIQKYFNNEYFRLRVADDALVWIICFVKKCLSNWGWNTELFRWSPEIQMQHFWQSVSRKF
ncbi:hypothetical protein ONA00_02160 [Mycoplasmopsis cynos]|nr:hypothetical protein [Mycoplasmopsis cynos]WAM11485.1 hypothetical protein ONA00_02160 [Mycoplasmopsis cynos]